MAKGIFQAKKNDGSIYYRSSIHRKGKKISLGSFDDEESAKAAYKEAVALFKDKSITLINYKEHVFNLSDDKTVSVLNFRDNGLYFKTPIYLRPGFFSYFLKDVGELKFDNEDLFYYGSHTIMKRGGHLFVNDYGSQYSLISRYGIKPYAVSGRDYKFVNEDPLDFRYENLLIINKYQGVRKRSLIKRDVYSVRIHINGEYNLGRFPDEHRAAICYNKAADLALEAGIKKDFMKNYIEELSPADYKAIYEEINLPEKYINYLSSEKSKNKG